MASIPKGVLTCPTCRKVNEIVKKNIMLYAFAFILLLEVVSSTILRDTIKPPCNPFWYVLFTQMALMIMFLNLNYNKDLLKFCQRQKIIVKSLLSYYILGSLSLIFNFSDNTYIGISKSILLIISFIALLLTIYKKKK